MREKRLSRETIGGGALILAALVTSGLMIVAVMQREPTPLELVLFQVIVLGLSLLGSYLFSLQSAHAATTERLRPHAGSAFRRTVSLYLAIRRFIESVETQRRVLLSLASDNGGTVSMNHIEQSLDLLDVQMREQVQTANDAMTDWKELVPADVADLGRLAGTAERVDSDEPD